MRTLRLFSFVALVFIAVIGSMSVVALRAQKVTAPRVSPGNVELVRQMLVDKIGVGPSECGRHAKPITNERAVAASVQCVLHAAKQDRPSWMVVYGQDAAESIQGAFSNRGGAVLRFHYEPMGDLGDGRAILGTASCPLPKIVQKDDEDFGRFVTVECPSLYRSSP